MNGAVRFLPLRGCLFLGLALLVPVLGEAHQFAPALLELEELDANNVAVRWKQPVIRVMGSQLQPVLPGNCSGVGRPKVRRAGTGMEATWQIECPGGLLGKTVGVEGIAGSMADVLLRVGLKSGRPFRHVLTPDKPSVTVPERENRISVLRSYGQLGVEHILTGYDHLLFVLGLTLLVGYGRMLLWTITAFTVGHSITLALAALGFVDFSPAPIEAAIAFSIYVLAVELARQDPKTLLRTYPWLVASLFGLLHGLGFAGALTKIGLPKGEIPLALFAFNVGIELGQLVFVGVILVLWTLVRRLPVRWPRMVALLPAYTIGSLAAFWFFERIWIALSVASPGS